jgi:hypothetical protein
MHDDRKKCGIDQGFCKNVLQRVQPGACFAALVCMQNQFFIPFVLDSKTIQIIEM